MDYLPPQDITSEARALIKRKVRCLLGKYGFTASDEEDLEQELALQLYIASAKYDAARGSPVTFYSAVLANKVKSIASAAKAQKRDHRRRRPLWDLDDVVQQPDAVPHLLVKLDVEDTFESLAPDLRPIATLFMDETAAGVIRATKMSRGRVRSARSRIARCFDGKGLNE